LSKEEPVDRNDSYDNIELSTGGAGRPEPILDRHTPSDKSDRHYDRRSGAECDRSSSRGSPSPAPTPGSVSSMGKSTPVGGVGGIFPSDSTTADQELGSGVRGSYKESPSSMRRPSEEMEPPARNYRGSRDDLIRMRNRNNSPPVDGRSNSGTKTKTCLQNNMIILF
jgi:hypothetical protein